MQITFVHQCHVAGKAFAAGQIVDRADLPPEWVTGALKAGFVTVPPGAKPEPTTIQVKTDVRPPRVADEPKQDAI